jgi:hypothetical protein
MGMTGDWQAVSANAMTIRENTGRDRDRRAGERDDTARSREYTPGRSHPDERRRVLPGMTWQFAVRSKSF